MSLEVMAIHRKRRVALFSDDVERPFANMIDEFGEETDDPEEAVRVVVMEAFDRWHVIELSEFGGKVN